MGKGSGSCSRPAMSFASASGESADIVTGAMRLPFPEQFVTTVDPNTGRKREFEQFWFIERDGRTLITPSKVKFNWTPEERIYRSVILDNDGEIASLSFDKFGNYGEEALFGDHMRILERELAEGKPVRFLEKMDGSLAIRSVIDGEVVFRTRGTHDGGEFGPRMRAVAEAKYPALLDPTLLPDQSMMFEYVSSDPNYQIVVKYDEEDLVFLGTRSHQTLGLGRWNELESLADEHGLNLVSTQEVPRDIDGMLNAVRDWRGVEGIVARCGDDQVYVKVKSASYLLLHRLRTQLSAKGVREMCEREDISSLSEFQEKIKETGADWEMLKDTQPLVESYLASSQSARKRFYELSEQVATLKTTLADDPRTAKKHFAVDFAKQLPREETPAAFALYERDENAVAAARAELADDRYTHLVAETIQTKKQFRIEAGEIRQQLSRVRLEIERTKADIGKMPKDSPDRVTANDDLKKLNAEVAQAKAELSRRDERARFEREFVASLSEPEQVIARDESIIVDAFVQMRGSYLDREFEALEAREAEAALAEDAD